MHRKQTTASPAAAAGQLPEDQAGRNYAMTRQTIPVGEEHAQQDHATAAGYYVIHGQITVSTSDRSVVLQAGSFIHIAGGTAHAFQNTGDVDAEVVVVMVPAESGRAVSAAGSSIDGNPAPDSLDSAPNIIIRHPGEGLRIAIVGDLYRFLAVTEETQGAYTLWEATVLPGGGPPPHLHRREEEGFLVLEGEITFVMDTERIVAGPGSVAHMPVGIEHAFRNEGQTPARMLIIVAPGGLENLFKRVGIILTDPNEGASPPPQDEIQRLLQLAPEYGIEINLPDGAN